MYMAAYRLRLKQVFTYFLLYFVLLYLQFTILFRNYILCATHVWKTLIQMWIQINASSQLRHFKPIHINKDDTCIRVFFKVSFTITLAIEVHKKKSVEYENPSYLKDHQSVPIISYATKYAYCNSLTTNIRCRISTLMTSKPPDCNCASSTFISNPHVTTGDVILTLSTALLYEMC